VYLLSTVCSSEKSGQYQLYTAIRSSDSVPLSKLRSRSALAMFNGADKTHPESRHVDFIYPTTEDGRLLELQAGDLYLW